MRERQLGRWERRREEREERKLMVRERDCGRNGRERVRVQRLRKSGIVKLGREGEGTSVRRRKEKIRERERARGMELNTRGGFEGIAEKIELKRGESTEIVEKREREVEVKEKRIRGRDAITREGTRVYLAE